MEILADILEIIMILCFGISWPFNIIKAHKTKTAKGTSLQFLLLITFGYVAGIVSKIVMWILKGNSYWTLTKIIAFIVYVINLTMIITAIFIYFKNKKLDEKNRL